MMNYDTIKDELLSVADRAIEIARRLDSGLEYEVFVYYEDSNEAEVDQGRATATHGAIAGSAVRAALGTRVAFACSSGMTVDRVRHSIQEAISVVKSMRGEDKRFKGFDDPRPSASESRFDKRILELHTDELVRICRDMAHDASSSDDHIKTVSAAASVSWGAYAVSNSRGILAATRFGMNYCAVDAQAQLNEERRSSYEYDVAVDRVVRPEGLGEAAAQNAVRLLRAKKLDFTGQLTTVWTQIPSALYFRASVGESVTGQPVVDGVSPLCDRIGDAIGPKHLTVVDDGQSPDGMRTRAIDAEGHPQQSTVLIEDGILKSYLFDSYYGRAFGLESTGNCSRGSEMFGGRLPYESVLSVSAHQVRVEPGRGTLEDLVSSIDGQAVLIRDFPLGIFHSDVSTGEFSIVANSVLLVNRGEVVGPLQPVSIAGNFYEGLRHLRAIGSDSRVTRFGVVAPSLVFDGFTVVG
ncbi:MAG: TldD/PmbA family protein [Candidatus Thorarchaeota archaeon]